MLAPFHTRDISILEKDCAVQIQTLKNFPRHWIHRCLEDRESSLCNESLKHAAVSLNSKRWVILGKRYPRSIVERGLDEQEINSQQRHSTISRNLSSTRSQLMLFSKTSTRVFVLSKCLSALWYVRFLRLNALKSNNLYVPPCLTVPSVSCVMNPATLLYLLLDQRGLEWIRQSEIFKFSKFSTIQSISFNLYRG